MTYSIGELANKLNLNPSAIRYYDKEGVLPHVDRLSSGRRIFTEEDFQFLQVIECLKVSGLSIKEIKAFSDLTLMGDNSLQERYELFLGRKEAIENQIKALNEALDTVNFKCWYYKTAVEAGTEKIHEGLQAYNLSDLVRLKEKTNL